MRGLQRTSYSESHLPWRNSPFGCPLNDLNFITLLIHYKDVSPSISHCALKTIGRHLWYLSAELVPLVLFSPCISTEEKNSLAACLMELMEKSTEDKKKKGVSAARRILQHSITRP